LTNNSVILCILDGFGISSATKHNAIAKAKTPTIDYFLKKYPNCLLTTSGKAVGLPEGQMGNSEVGHMTIGSGRVIDQDLVRINKAIESGELEKNPIIKKLLTKHKKNDKKVHLFGLCSDGGVHSHINHIIFIAQILAKAKVKTCLHLFLDGRDVAPKSAPLYLDMIDQLRTEYPQVDIATLSGRFYSMDRDKRLQRTIEAVEAIEGKASNKFTSWKEYLANQYGKEIYDEFIEPASHENYKGIDEDDSLVFLNFRSDRIRQLIEELSKRHNQLSFKIGMTSYFEDNSKNLDSLFAENNIAESLGEIISNNNMKQLRMSETEKYAHVTFFFNGGREKVFAGEDRILVNSPNVKTYDQKPEMSAQELTDKLIEAINSKKYHLIVINYANCDMVGHSGNFEASVKAVEHIDKCLKRVYDCIKKTNHQMLITADHGNVEYMFDEEKNIAHTSHTLNPVPCILVGKTAAKYKLKNGNISDVAPTILELLKLKKPSLMSGKSLLKKKNEFFSFLTAVFIALAIRTIIFEPYAIPSGSMKPNFLVGDYLFVSKYPYGISNASLPLDPPIMTGRKLELSTPQRGEVIVFKSQTERSINYIKRLIGLPGDEIQMVNGILYINGLQIPKKEAGVFEDTDGKILKKYIETLPNGVSYYVLDDIDYYPLDNTPIFKVPEGHYFFIGDNRDHSSDSRTGGRPIGFVPYDKLIGRAEMVIFSNPVHFYEIWKWPFNFYHDRFFLKVKSLSE
jgi:2,3-bisphosphoglycerate-independent phosphoglycerate mutase